MNISNITMDQIKANVADVCSFFRSAEGQAIFDKLVAGCTKAEFEELIKENEDRLNDADKEFIERVVNPCFVKQEEPHKDDEAEPEAKKDRKVLKGILWGIGLVAAGVCGVLAAKWLSREKVAAAAATATDAAQTVADATTTATTAA